MASLTFVWLHTHSLISSRQPSGDQRSVLPTTAAEISPGVRHAASQQPRQDYEPALPGSLCLSEIQPLCISLRELRFRGGTVGVICEFLRTNNKSCLLGTVLLRELGCSQRCYPWLSSKVWPQNPNQRFWLKIKLWPRDLWRAEHQLPDSCQEPPGGIPRALPFPFTCKPPWRGFGLSEPGPPVHGPCQGWLLMAGPSEGSSGP